jgi:transcription initiation factor IIE alpha subunit
MKKKITIILTAVAFAFGSALLLGCGGQHAHEGHGEAIQSETTEHAHVHYACPMDCEEGMTYEVPGKCPVCKMDLTEVTEDAATATEATHDHEHTYACPMHAEITGHAGDKCSKCGMDLEEVKE